MEENQSDLTAEDVIAQAEQLPPEEQERLLESLTSEPEPPLVGWASNPLKTKAALRHLTAQGECTRSELADFLGTVEELGDVRSMHYGLVGRESNDLFRVEKGDSKADDRMSLTRRGEEAASKFNDDLSGLTPVETSLYRGLHMYGHTVAFLGELERYRRQDGSHEDGILKTDLIDNLSEYYGDEAESFVGYSGTLCKRLGLIERTRDGNQVRYKLVPPREWYTTG